MSSTNYSGKIIKFVYITASWHVYIIWAREDKKFWNMFHASVFTVDGQFVIPAQPITLNDSYVLSLSLCLSADPLVGSIATQYLTNRTEHDRIAKQWTKRYAT